jgi:hypothetical protein
LLRQAGIEGRRESQLDSVRWPPAFEPSTVRYEMMP